MAVTVCGWFFVFLCLFDLRFHSNSMWTDCFFSSQIELARYSNKIYVLGGFLKLFINFFSLYCLCAYSMAFSIFRMRFEVRIVNLTMARKKWSVKFFSSQFIRSTEQNVLFSTRFSQYFIVINNGIEKYWYDWKPLGLRNRKNDFAINCFSSFACFFIVLAINQLFLIDD